MPRLTLFVALSSIPIFNAISIACFGDFISGAVAISMRGIPSLSSAYFISFPFSPIFLAASSSRHIVSILIPSILPFKAIKAVL